jgi:2-polyprenyl-6-methoxyphenol hydroxylase-like FAD-dependent oxidoreductase
MKALIIGGGIAGPVTALALQRAGIDATIYESHPRTDGDVGSFFTVTANGLTALDAVGALGVARQAGFPTRRNVLWNHAGRRLASIPLDATLPGSPAALTMKRSQLARLLQDEALARGIQIEFGRRLADASVTSDGRVTATFDDGATASGDLLIGADGVHSVVRRLIDPMAPSGRYVGLTNFGGFTRGAGQDVEPEAWHMIFGRRAFFGYHATPTGDVVWFANAPRPKISPRERDATTSAEWRRQLASLFVDDDGPAVELIDAGELDLAADNTHDLRHVAKWHRGPLIILGDAAHAPSPSSGQGASMAIEDAVILASALRENGSIAEAFAAFERSRRERVERIVAWGARGSSSKVPGRFGRAVRDLMLPLMFRTFVTQKSLAWMYDYRVAPDRAAGDDASAAIRTAS